MALPFSVGIVTVSDTSADDPTKDKSGPLLAELINNASSTNAPYHIAKTIIIGDEPSQITNVINDWTDRLALILLTGGTGFAERDVTPDTVTPLLTRLTPGITHLLLATSLTKTPFAALSRPVSGFRNKTLIITLPGSPKACRENMEALFPILPHALELAQGKLDKVQQTHHQLASSGDHIASGKHRCVHHHQHSQPQQPHHPHGKESPSGRAMTLNTPVSQRHRSSPYPMISVEEATSIVSQYATLLETVSTPVSEKLIGYVLAENVYAKESVPAYRASVVDGYAVHVEDGPGIYPVSHVSLASSSAKDKQSLPFKLERGHIARVTTGGMVPDGANAVIMVEDTKLVQMTADGKEEAMVEILTSATVNEMIRGVGSDCCKGDMVCAKGTTMSTVGGELGVLASVGVTEVLVYRKPRVGILSSGNEVQDITVDRSLLPGEIRDSNRLTLMAAVRQAGMEPVDLGIVSDNVDDIEVCLRKALIDMDVIISTGGVSMGEADFMKPLLEQKLNAILHFGRVHMKPGKPTTFATVPSGNDQQGVRATSTAETETYATPTLDSHKLVFALPGNPVSATVTFYLFVLPALRKMSGMVNYENVTVPVKIAHPIHLDSRPEYHRVRVYINAEQGCLEASSTGNQQSSRMISMLAANGLLQLPSKQDHLSTLNKGDTVPCVLLGPLYQN